MRPAWLTDNGGTISPVLCALLIASASTCKARDTASGTQQVAKPSPTSQALIPESPLPAVPSRRFDALCDENRQHNLKQFARARELAEKRLDQAVSSGRLTPEVSERIRRSAAFTRNDADTYNACLSVEQGAWAFRVERAAPIPASQFPSLDNGSLSAAIDATITLAFLSSKGEILRLGAAPTFARPVNDARALPRGNCCQSETYFLPNPQLDLASDYDGDGRAEVHVSNSWSHEGPGGVEHWLLTSRSGKLSRLTTPAFSALKDVDHDGLADLVLDGPGQWTSTSCGSGFESEQSTVEFVAHALPKAEFSTTDAVAVAHVRRQCPSAPTKLLGSRDVVCALLFGVGLDEITQRLTQDCEETACDEKTSEALPVAGKKPRCDGSYKELALLGRTPLPFVFKEEVR
jgi:hypothetical protein